MHLYKVRDGEEDRKPGGKTHATRDMESVGLKQENIPERTKWNLE